MEAAINAADALYSEIPYNNLKEAGEYLPFRVKDTFIKNPTFEKLIVIRPIISVITIVR